MLVTEVWSRSTTKKQPNYDDFPFFSNIVNIFLPTHNRTVSGKRSIFQKNKYSINSIFVSIHRQAKK